MTYDVLFRTRCVVLLQDLRFRGAQVWRQRGEPVPHLLRVRRQPAGVGHRRLRHQGHDIARPHRQVIELTAATERRHRRRLGERCVVILQLLLRYRCCCCV